MNEIYFPEEDSYFLSDILKKELNLIKNKENLTFLEIGSGSGIQLKTALNSGIKNKNIFSCDINKNAVKYCKKLGFNSVNSNLFSKINKKFDIIIFNPPYLPENKFDNGKDTTGGKKGNEVILEFLEQSRFHLNDKGFILLLTSSFTPKINFNKFKYSFKKIASRKLFFEELYIWKLE